MEHQSTIIQIVISRETAMNKQEQTREGAPDQGVPVEVGQ